VTFLRSGSQKLHRGLTPSHKLHRGLTPSQKLHRGLTPEPGRILNNHLIGELDTE